MSIDIFITGFCSVLSGWLVHLAWWRIARPVDDLRALAVCMVLVPAALLAATFFLGFTDPVGLLLSLLLAGCLGSAYIFWYPAAQAASPTMLMTVIAARAGDRGCTGEAFRKQLPEELLSGNSLDSLVGERFASEDMDGRIRLAPRGRRTLVLIRLLRHSAGFDDPKG